MWGKLLKFPAHPPYKPIRSTHEQRSETGASKRKKISCGSRSGVVRGRQGSSGVVRGRQGSSWGRQGSSGVVSGRQGSSGVVRGRQGSSGVVRGRQGSSGVVRGRLGVVRGRQGSSGAVRGRQGSSGVVRGRQGSSGVVSDRGHQSRQESSAKIGQLLLPSLLWFILINSIVSIDRWSNRPASDHGSSCPWTAGDPVEPLQPEGSVPGQLHQQGDHHQQDATGELGNLPRDHGPRW